MELAGSRLVATGISSGIGAAVGRLLVQEGASVVGGHAPAEEPNGGFVLCDLGELDSLDACLSRLPDRVDGLANTAGLPGTSDPVTIGRVNFLGLRHLTEAIHTRMNAGGSVAHFAGRRELISGAAVAQLRKDRRTLGDT